MKIRIFRIATDELLGFEVQERKTFLFWHYWKKARAWGDDDNSFDSIESIKKDWTHVSWCALKIRKRGCWVIPKHETWIGFYWKK